jgi:hypothetical protein
LLPLRGRHQQECNNAAGSVDALAAHESPGSVYSRSFKAASCVAQSQLHAAAHRVRCHPYHIASFECSGAVLPRYEVSLQEKGVLEGNGGTIDYREWDAWTGGVSVQDYQRVRCIPCNHVFKLRQVRASSSQTTRTSARPASKAAPPGNSKTSKRQRAHVKDSSLQMNDASTVLMLVYSSQVCSRHLSSTSCTYLPQAALIFHKL